MAQDQTVIDLLLAGRQALHGEIDQANAEVERLNVEQERLRGEVTRLTGAIEQLDSVIGMVESGAGAPPPARVSAPQARTQPPAAAAPARPSAPAKRAATRTRKSSGQAPKSIRVHVLEMLAAENRDWSLAEIIDRIHGAGIQAHDDAVRSITIKLMKDGRVERVGRGQYRLARRGSSRSTDTVAAAPSVEAVSETPPAADPVTEQLSDPIEATTDTDVIENPAAAEPQEVSIDEAEVSEVVPSEPETVEPETVEPENRPEERSYTPPLNLGQPWS